MMKRNKLNPIDIMKSYNIAADHIEYIPMMKGDYEIRRSCSHDGTMVFNNNLVIEILNLILNKTSFCKKDKVDWKNLKDVRYKIGDLKMISKYKYVDLPVGRVPGEETRVILPVKCEYIY